ncbi:hypothetical protein F4818DRAFT_415479 [Hypoxylon cercidicola]|nr:hypothetical protein F4818DRAFT_415479 [Hypoxylon cercidicola]
MSGIVGMWSKSPGPKSVNGDKELRGTKRKAKGDPYDDIDDDDSIPNATPSTQRAGSRISSEVPIHSAKTRSSTASRASKRRSRSSGTRKVDGAEGSRTDANANLARAHEPQAARLQPQPEGEYTHSSLVPVADMGIPEPAKDSNTAASAQGPANDATTEPADKHVAKGDAKGKAKATEVDEGEEKQDEADRREEHEVKALVKHRMALDGSGRVEFLVHWAGEEAEDATWETEEEIQNGAGETLYAYWKAQGGRMNALFIKPKNPPPEIYHVYSILDHERKARGGFEFEVQWVGHPPTRGETTMEAEPKLKKIAPEALEEYWESRGGRDKFLAKRGRNKKPRTE